MYICVLYLELRDPFLDVLCDFEVVLLHEEHVAVAMNASLAKFQMLDLLTTGLSKEVDGAVVIHGVIT